MQNWVFDIRSRPFVILSVVFLIISLLVIFEVTAEFDYAVSDYFHAIAGTMALDIFMESVTEVGDIFYMLIFTIILIIIKRTRKIGIVLIILLVLSTLITGYVKCGVDRNRPDLEFVGYPFMIDSSSDTYSLFCKGGFNASYPSGHAARAAIFGIIIGFVLSERFPRGSYLLLLYPILTSISRIYLLEHYPMDVIGGSVLGILLAGAVGQKTKLYSIFKSKI